MVARARGGLRAALRRRRRRVRRGGPHHRGAAAQRHAGAGAGRLAVGADAAGLQILPDPPAAALAPDLPATEEELRVTRRGAGVAIPVPDGWLSNRLPSSQTWIFAPEINVRNTYSMRADLKIGQRVATSVAKSTRIEALESAEAQGNIQALTITAETDDSFRATYITNSYLKLTMEQWVAGPDGLAAIDVAVTGRMVDEEGLGDLLARTVESARYLEPLPPKADD